MGQSITQVYRAPKGQQPQGDHSIPLIAVSHSTAGLSLQTPVAMLCITCFNIQQFYVLPTQCIFVFCVDLRTNSDYLPLQH